MNWIANWTSWWQRRRGGAAPGRWAPVSAWCRDARLRFETNPSQEEFAIEGRVGSVPWQLYWSRPQRLYVAEREMRMQAELGLPGELQLLLLDRQLADSLRHAVLSQVSDTRRPDVTEMPPEMRWAVSLPRVDLATCGLAGAGLVGMTSHPEWLQAWAASALGAGLRAQPVARRTPWLLMVHRGAVLMRTEAPDPEPQALQPWIELFEIALREARRVQTEIGDPAEPTTVPSLWAGSELPDDSQRP